MQADVQPAADRIVGRVFPSLQAVAVGEVVCRLVVVEGLIAVLNGREEGRDDPGSEEAVESGDGLDCVRTRRSRREEEQV